MPFRADYAAEDTRRNAVSYFAYSLPPDLRGHAVEAMDRLVNEHGPFVDHFPAWHPLVSFTDKHATLINELYPGCDHTRPMRNAILTCPYKGGYPQLSAAVHEINTKFSIGISIKRLNEKFYSPDAQPILISYDWDSDCDHDGISQRQAVGLMVEFEMKSWKSAKVGETVETMRSYLLGQPCGRRSSLFVNEKTGQALLNTYKALVDAGIYGPVYGGKA